MNEGLIPQRYAKALYLYAKEQGVVDNVYDSLQLFENNCVAHNQLMSAINNPFLAKVKKEQLMCEAVGKAADKSLIKFIQLVLNNRREEYMRLIGLAYQDKFRNEHGISRVAIVTAASLPDTEMTKIKSLMQTLLKGKTLEFTYEVDESLIGGFLIKVDSKILDASISNELKKLRLKLLNSK